MYHLIHTLHREPSTQGMRWPALLPTQNLSCVRFSYTFYVSVKAHRTLTAIPPLGYHQCPSSPCMPHGQLVIFRAHPSNIHFFSPDHLPFCLGPVVLPFHHTYPKSFCEQRIVEQPTASVHQRVIWFVWQQTCSAPPCVFACSYPPKSGFTVFQSFVFRTSHWWRTPCCPATEPVL